jgi:hypothetical protein
MTGIHTWWAGFRMQRRYAIWLLTSVEQIVSSLYNFRYSISSPSFISPVHTPLRLVYTKVLLQTVF